MQVVNIERLCLMIGAVGLLVAIGCNHPSGTGRGTASQATGISGSVGNGGGQQTVAGAMIQIYEVGTTGDASAATPLLNAPLITDATGLFHTDQKLACSSSNALVYLTATGRDFGAAIPSANSSLALIALAGPCSSLTAPNYFYINDVSTISAVAALGPFIASASMVGSANSDSSLLEASFNLANIFYNLDTGYIPSASVPSGDTVPQEEINTLGNILFSCVDSKGGVAGDGSDCGNLFTLTTQAGAPAPTDTISAAINLMANPASKTAALFALAAPSAPSQPILSSVPSDFSVVLEEPAGISIAQAYGIDFSIPTGSTSSMQMITLSDGGTSPITINSMTINGVNATDYALVNSCNTVLTAGSSCSVQVSFSPTASGYRHASVQIVTNASKFVRTVPLRGLGT